MKTNSFRSCVILSSAVICLMLPFLFAGCRKPDAASIQTDPITEIATETMPEDVARTLADAELIR